MRHGRFDVIHTHDFYTNIFGMAAAALARVPVRVASRRETEGLRCGAKKRLADLVVGEYHDGAGAGEARKYFETKFQRREIPQDVPTFKLGNTIWVCELMKQLQEMKAKLKVLIAEQEELSNVRSRPSTSEKLCPQCGGRGHSATNCPTEREYLPH